MFYAGTVVITNTLGVKIDNVAGRKEPMWKIGYKIRLKSSNFSDLTCLFNNGLSLVTSKDSLINRLNLCDS